MTNEGFWKSQRRGLIDCKQIFLHFVRLRRQVIWGVWKSSETHQISSLNNKRYLPMLPTNCWLPMLTSNFDHQSWLPILTTNFDYQCWLPKRSLQRSMEGKGRVSMNHMKVLQNNQRIDAAVNLHYFNCFLPFKRNNCQILQKSLQFISKSSKNHYKHAFFTVVRLRWCIYAYKQVLQGIKNHRDIFGNHCKTICKLYYY